MSTPPGRKEAGVPVVITGMHRSGTSLLANLLAEAGVALGEELMEATEFNPKGYFEDLEFHDLQDEVLRADAPDRLYRPTGRSPRLTREHLARVDALVEARRRLDLWGWKDPRTCLFLDFWAERLPRARFVFIFRRPEFVIDSLRRRGDRELFHWFPGAWFLGRFGFSRFRRRRAVRMWLGYNRAVVRFAHRHPERCLVLDLGSLEEDFPRALEVMRTRWGLDVRDVALDAVLEESLLSHRPPADLLAACRGAAVRRTLEALHGLRPS